MSSPSGGATTRGRRSSSARSWSKLRGRTRNSSGTKWSKPCASSPRTFRSSPCWAPSLAAKESTCCAWRWRARSRTSAIVRDRARQRQAQHVDSFAARDGAQHGDERNVRGLEAQGFDHLVPDGFRVRPRNFDHDRAELLLRPRVVAPPDGDDIQDRRYRRVPDGDESAVYLRGLRAVAQPEQLFDQVSVAAQRDLDRSPDRGFVVVQQLEYRREQFVEPTCLL